MTFIDRKTWPNWGPMTFTDRKTWPNWGPMTFTDRKTWTNWGTMTFTDRKTWPNWEPMIFTDRKIYLRTAHVHNRRVLMSTTEEFYLTHVSVYGNQCSVVGLTWTWVGLCDTVEKLTLTHTAPLWRLLVNIIMRLWLFLCGWEAWNTFGKNKWRYQQITTHKKILYEFLWLLNR